MSNPTATRGHTRRYLARCAPVTLAVLGVSALGGGDAAAATTAADGSHASAHPALEWKRCAGAPAAQCAVLWVPLDWSRPGGTKVKIALSRLPATDRRHRLGSVLFNCGGPGCPGALVVKNRPMLFSPRLRERFDVIGFDPRATGTSTPVRCGRPAPDPTIPTFPASGAQYRRLVAFNRALYRSCRRRTGPYLMNVGATSVVRDIEAIRVALRDGKLNWLGLSYGTMLGGLYAERYPKRMRAMVLDGALDRSLSEPGMLADEAWASNDNFTRWAEWCRSSLECPLAGQDVLGVWDRLVASANRAPIPAPEAGHRVSGQEMQNSVGGQLLFTRPNAFSPASWLSIGPSIVRAQSGNASQLAMPVAKPPDDPLYGVQAISCLDFPTQAESFADFNAEVKFARLRSPHLGGATQTGGIISSCSGWPKPARDPRHFLHVRGAPPILIVNATHDPSTSYVWALNMHTQIPRSRLLTRDGDGHTSYLSSPCAQSAIDRYLITRALPAVGAQCHD